MNAVEIEEAVSKLAEAPFDADQFPTEFLLAFGFKETTVKRRRADNKSDVAGGLILQGQIHLATCSPGKVPATLDALRASPKTAAMKVRFILATDGDLIEAADLATGEPLSCAYGQLHNRFGFLLPLAGISTVDAIKENPIDVKATARLNKLYVELLKHNPDWQTEALRPELNRLLARLIFCFFAEDTGIFPQKDQFTRALQTLTEPSGANTHEVLAELFRAMATHPDCRKAEAIKSWADAFLYVNGGLFSDAGLVPVFSRDARNYLLRAGELSWQSINPDIFGSMIQAVAADAEDDERQQLGMHYTSVPNILKVLNPLFLDDLRAELAAAGDSVRKLNALRRRIANIRVFDPACGSGNFLVIAYIQMREIEHEIVKRTGADPRSVIPLTNFYGIEIKGFAAEIARLALLIAEFQSDARLIDQRQACANVLPLHATGQIVVGNALQVDWRTVCQPKMGPDPILEEDLAGPTGRLNLAPPRPVLETYICGNPPYKGSQTQSKQQKADLEALCDPEGIAWRQLDYVAGWFVKAAAYIGGSTAMAAFVSTNSICQGRGVPILWPFVFSRGLEIRFAHESFKWANLASHNAGVTVVIVGLGNMSTRPKTLFSQDGTGDTRRTVEAINAYLIAAPNIVIEASSRSLSDLPRLDFGNMPADGGALLLSRTELSELDLQPDEQDRLIRRALGSAELIRGIERYCIWITDPETASSIDNPGIRARIDQARCMRLASKDPGTRALAERPYQFREQKFGTAHTIAIPSVSSENREYFPALLLDRRSTVTNLAFGCYDGPLWSLAIVVSKLNLAWLAVACGKLETRYRYSNTLGWNTLPVPTLTAQNKVDLTRCAEDILLAREAHFPATIADLYDPDEMPDDLRRAHDRNDETLERIYIGRRFRNDTERLEKLFELYTRMTASDGPGGDKGRAKKSRKAA